MRRVAMILGAAAIVAVVAGGAQAAIWAITPDNYDNGFSFFPWIPGDDSGAGFTLPGGPSATVDGAVWMKKPSGVWPSTGSQYQLFDPGAANWGIGINVFVNTTTGWQMCYDGSPWCFSAGYAGYWAHGTSVALPSNVVIAGTDTNTIAAYGYSESQAQFYVQAWVDPSMEHDTVADGTYSGILNSPYKTYATAYAASAAGADGVLVGTTPVFLGDVWDSSSVPGDFVNQIGTYMPSLILQKAVPEPSTILLATAGLLGLLAYAWRKRK